MKHLLKCIVENENYMITMYDDEKNTIETVKTGVVNTTEKDIT